MSLCESEEASTDCLPILTPQQGNTVPKNMLLWADRLVQKPHNPKCDIQQSLDPYEPQCLRISDLSL